MENEIIPYQDPKALAEFLDKPEIKIAELVTGALAMGKSEAIFVAGRIVQGALKGNLMKQVGRELQSLIKKGRIEEDYAKAKFGFQSFAELLVFIDSEVPDEDRLKAVKALFYSVIDKSAPIGAEILRYQLFQIAKRLNSSQLLTLRAAYECKQLGIRETGADGWRMQVSKQAGHGSAGLVYNDEVTLEREKLIGSTIYSDHSGIRNTDTARLTDLGITLVELITKYENFAVD